MKIVKNQNIWFTSDTHYSHSNICSATSKWKASNLTRKFSSLEEMNNTIINNINNKVGEDDILFHLGDWSFGGLDKIFEFRKQIKCKNIHLILGNHDHHIENKKFLFNSADFGKPNEEIFHWYYNNNNLEIKPLCSPNYVRTDMLFNSVNHYLELEIQIPQGKGQKIIKYNFVLMHYPIASWKGMNDGVIHLHGHVHLPPHYALNEGKALDVGMDGFHLNPYNLDDIISIMKNQPIKKLTLPKDHHEERIS